MRACPARLLRGLLLGILLLAGCRNDSIHAYSAPKEPLPQRVTPPVAATMAGQETVTWTLPSGWQQLPGEGMRFATVHLDTNSQPPLELRVTPLALAAGDVLANVNRWREQIGLPHIDAAELASVARHADTDGRSVHLVNMRAPGPPARAVLAAILPGDQQAWFFLVMDTPERIAPHTNAFEAFMASVRVVAAAPAAASLPPGHPPLETAAATAPPAQASNPGLPLQWTTPPGWRQRQETNPSRLATLEVGDGGSQAEVTITRFPGAVGGLLANINRWRGQIGLEPVAALAAQPLESLDVDGQTAQLLDLTAADGATRLLVLLVPRADFTYFVKMTGPAPLVTAQCDAFLDFARSLRFERERS